MYEISGDGDHYADAMFPPMDDGSGQIVLRPMNCPHHPGTTTLSGFGMSRLAGPHSVSASRSLRHQPCDTQHHATFSPAQWNR